MCNGDLGMYRVMPWAYPTIAGQSTGGVTVDPTPEPTPVPKDPLDFSNAKFYLPSVKGVYSSPWLTVDVLLECRDIVSNDTSNISSIKFEILGDNISVDPVTVAGTRLIVEPTSHITYGPFNNLNGNFLVLRAYQQYVSAGNGMTFTPTGVTGVKITAYGSDGSIVQEYEGVLS